MSEQDHNESEPSAQEIENLRERFLEEFEFVFNVLSPDADGFAICPFGILLDDERTSEELHPLEREAIYKVAFEVMEIKEENMEEFLHRAYQSSESDEVDQNDIEVRVYRTSRSDEGVFLHEFHHTDGIVRYLLSEDRDF